MKKLLILFSFVLIGSSIFAQVPPKDKEMYERMQKSQIEAESKEKEEAYKLAEQHYYKVIAVTVAKKKDYVTSIEFDQVIQTSAINSRVKIDSENLINVLSNAVKRLDENENSLQTILNTISQARHQVVAQSAILDGDYIIHYLTVRSLSN